MRSPSKTPRHAADDDPLQVLARAIQRRYGAAGRPSGTTERRLQAFKREFRQHRTPHTPASRH